MVGTEEEEEEEEEDEVVVVLFVPVAEGGAKRRAGFCASTLPSRGTQISREHSIAARVVVVATGIVVGFPEVEEGSEEQEALVGVMVVVAMKEQGVVLLVEVGVATRW